MLSNGMNGPKLQNTSHINIVLGSDCNWTRTQSHLVRKRTLNHLAKLARMEAHKVESFFDKFVDYLIVTLLEMKSTLTILLQFFLKAINVDFFVYKTTGFIHVADIVFTDRFP